MTGDGADRWLVLSVPAAPPGQEHLLVDALRRAGARAVEREGDRVLAWLAPGAAPDKHVRRAVLAIRASTSQAEPDVRWRWESGGQWATRWARDLSPRWVTDRIVVAPADAPEAIPEDAVLVRLEPTAAFGTAEHPSTRACLRFLDGLIRPGHKVADLGTGSGVLAIAAVLLGAQRALAVDSDDLACDAARANAAQNGVSSRVRVRRMRVTPAVLGRLGRFDIVTANLEAGLIRELMPALSAALAPGGRLVLAGVLVAERDGVLRAARSGALELEADEEEAGWWAGHLRLARA